MSKLIEALLLRAIFLIPVALTYVAGTHTPGVGVLVYPVTFVLFCVTQTIAGLMAE